MSNQRGRADGAETDGESDRGWPGTFYRSLGLFCAVYLAALLLGITLSALRTQGA